MEKYVLKIVDLARKAAKKGEVPVGAVIVYKEKIIAKGYNQRERKRNVTGHAEIITIRKAARKLKTWKLNDCDLYVTLKPCSMCDSIIKQSRIKNVYYLLDKLEHKSEYNKTNVCKIANDTNYETILSEFFVNKRNEKK